jgi:hypothetical protein
MAATKAAKKTPAKKTEAKSEGKKFKQPAGFVISQKRSGRYQVRTAKGKQVNGADKTKILLDAKLIDAGTPKAKEEAPATAES